MLSPHEPVVDLRTVEPASQERVLLAAFRKLSEGQSFLLMLDKPPTQMYAAFTREYPDTASWRPLRTGPLEWCLRISCRPHPSLEKGLGDMFRREQDHLAMRAALLRAELDACWNDPSRGPAGLRRALGELDEAFERCARHETEFLFPAVELYNPWLLGSRAEVMRLQLQESRKLLDRLWELTGHDLTPHRVAVAAETMREIQLMLEDHDEKEAGIYLPLAERTPAPERERLLSRMKLG